MNIEDPLLMQQRGVKQNGLLVILRQACKKIAPVWPLENFVAVNPYLGLSDQKFDVAAQYLAQVGGIQMTLPVSFYLNKFREGKISRSDLAAAMFKNSSPEVRVEEFIESLKKEENRERNTATLATLTDIATQWTGKDWNRFTVSRVSVWAASYFDKGQASLKATNQNLGLFSSWKAEASVDLTPEIMGLKGFRKTIKALPNEPIEAALMSLETLDIPQQALPVYLHRLLLRVGGWSAYVAQQDWDSELYGGKDGKLIEFLAILICWEACLLQSLANKELSKKWVEAKSALSEVDIHRTLSSHITQKLILQDAFDRAAQRELIEKFQRTKDRSPEVSTHKKAQAIFCIDVRSEVFRRNLELTDREIETLGFAGFFAFPINFVPIAHTKGEAQCPVLIPTGPNILEEIPNKEDNRIAHQKRRAKHHVRQLWKSFKTGAVTCFSFVSPVGLSYLPKLFSDSFGLTRPVSHPDKTGLSKELWKNRNISLEVEVHNNWTVGIPVGQRVQMAKNALSAMSLTDGFASFVLIVGHGSTSVNNPYASGLDCGACGGHTGEANAKVAAAVLNDTAVREQLKKEGILIPNNTIFLACLHDTTTDEITIFNEQEVPPSRKEELLQLKMSLVKAGHAARTERALRMPPFGNVDVKIKERSKDWSQVRPEWGLAGCSSFVVAPRNRTTNIDFKGQTFLHSYEWKKDYGFSILELIMTAPMIVTSWINLQYYASTVDNKNFGSGNKTLHNVTAGVGVLEGFSGDLRVGLPIQSVHDGENYQHEPVKLNVIIEAPLEAMNEILKKHTSVRHLCDNEWIYLLAMNDQGLVSHRYAGDLQWDEL